MKVIVAGSGKIVYYLARQFTKKRYKIMIVTPYPEEASDLSQRIGVPVLVGDATDPQVLEDAGAYQAEAVLALTPYDEDNLAVCQIAGQMYNVPRTIALVNDPENEDIFRKLNVSAAISATRILSILLEEQAGFEEIGKMISVAEGNVSVLEVVLREGAPTAGVLISAIDFPEEALIGGIIRGGTVVIPKGGTKLQSGDRLIVIATQESLDQVMHVLTGE